MAAEAERLAKEARHFQHRTNEAESNSLRHSPWQVRFSGAQDKTYWVAKDRERVAWKLFHHFQDSFVDLRSVHAITAHRSQGSTFDTVFVDAKDIKASNDKFRLLYVACTRARNLVYIRES